MLLILLARVLDTIISFRSEIAECRGVSHEAPAMSTMGVGILYVHQAQLVWTFGNM